MFKQQLNDFQVKFCPQKYALYIFCQAWKTHQTIPLQQGLWFKWQIASLDTKSATH